MDEQAIPEQAHWFYVERKGPRGEWQPVKVERQQYHEVGLDPRVVAATQGEGTYRTTYTTKTRRRKLLVGFPWELTERPTAQAEPVEQRAAAVAAADLDDQADQADDEQPASGPATAAPMAAKPPKDKRRKAHRYDMPTMDPAALAPPEGLTLHPLGQFVYLESLTQQRGDKFHALLLQAMNMTVENERSRAREYVATLERHYAEIEASRRDLMAAMLAVNTAKPIPELAQLTATVEKLAEQVEDLSDEDVGDIDPQALAKLSENPNDLERALAAVQNIVAAVANSPIGSALAERLREAGAPLPPE